MIYGNINELKNYKGISKNLDTAIEYILSGEYKSPKMGKNIIDEGRVFFNFNGSVITQNKKNPELEYHKKYIDIHIILEGEENIVYTSFDKCKETIAYSQDRDVAFLEAETELEFYMDKNKFLILFPYEAHMALLSVVEAKEIKKIVLKIEA